MSQAIRGDTLPPEKRGLGLCGIRVTAIFAPALVPTVGGWSTTLLVALGVLEKRVRLELWREQWYITSSKIP